MMGDRNYRELIKNAINSIAREIELKIDRDDVKTIHLTEVVRCLRRSYFDRIDPLDIDRRGFNDLVSGLLRSMKYGAKLGEYKMHDINLKGQADMIIDDAIIIFRSINELPEDPRASDLLYLNACMWTFDKIDGIIIYMTGDRKEASFSLSRNKKMFEELARRVRIFSDLLNEKKVPVLEPSEECSTCQYYSRCYITQRVGRSISLHDLVGMKKNS